jgi:hypothetical protein
MFRVGFEFTVSASAREQTVHTLDRWAIVAGLNQNSIYKYFEGALYLE